MDSSHRVKKIVLTSILLAIMIILQVISQFLKIGPFQIALVLIPITIGAILIGPLCGLFLGFSLGVIVLLNGDASIFLSYNIWATILVVLLKSSIAGLLSGYFYKLFKEKYEKIAIIGSSIITPIINSGLFAIGTLLFFSDLLIDMSTSTSSNPVSFLFLSLIGVNFIIELSISIVLCPALIYIKKIAQSKFDFVK